MDNKGRVEVIQQGNNESDRKFAIAMVIAVLVVAAFMLFFWLGYSNAKQETYNREMQEYYESKIQETGVNTELDFNKAE
jgi:flagellar basal body-associated protein FliL